MPVEKAVEQPTARQRTRPSRDTGDTPLQPPTSASPLKSAMKAAHRPTNQSPLRLPVTTSGYPTTNIPSHRSRSETPSSTTTLLTTLDHGPQIPVPPLPNKPSPVFPELLFSGVKSNGQFNSGPSNHVNSTFAAYQDPTWVRRLDKYPSLLVPLTVRPALGVRRTGGAGMGGYHVGDVQLHMVREKPSPWTKGMFRLYLVLFFAFCGELQQVV